MRINNYDEYTVADNIVNKNSKIWRYMDIMKFLYLLENKALYMCQVDSFDDPLEGKIPISVRNKFKSIADNGDEYESLKKILDKAEKDAENNFVNCWHLNEYDNHAMWNIYAKDSLGIAIESTIKRLNKAILIANHGNKGELLLAQVLYVDYSSPKTAYNIILKERMTNVNFFKSKSFDHERELRLVTVKNQNLDQMIEKFKGKNKKPHYDLKVDLSELIEKIWVSPTAPESSKKLIETTIQKWGLNCKVEQTVFDDYLSNEQS